MIGNSFYRSLRKPFRACGVCLAALFCHACTGTAIAEKNPAITVLIPEQQVSPLLSVQGFSSQEPWQQGSLIRGKTLPGSQVMFLDNNVYVNEQGEFVLGLGRDAPAKVDVAITDPSGARHVHSFDVVQRQYNIQRVEGVEEKYVTPSEKDQKRIDLDNALISEARRLREPRADFAEGFIWPLLGAISGVYGSQRFFNGEGRQPHYGVDVVGPVGALVRAPAAGKVTFARDMYYSGWTLVIDHGQGLSSSFLHLSNILVKVGDSVKQGDSIAEVGATGRVTGAHLDWRMNWLDQRIDPQLLVPAMPTFDETPPSAKAPSATE